MNSKNVKRVEQNLPPPAVTPKNFPKTVNPFSQTYIVDIWYDVSFALSV